jgi:anti-sigma regulatory factor (Ser/Thr protein kinase)
LDRCGTRQAEAGTIVTHPEQTPDRIAVDGTPADSTVLGDLWLPNRPESAAAARRFVTSIAMGWDVAHLVDTLQLLVSELIGNAVRHTLDPAQADPSMLRLLMTRQGQWLRTEVHDTCCGVPRLKHADEEEESGRGYFLVVTLADEVGSYPTPDGKAVWFRLLAWPSRLAA